MSDKNIFINPNATSIASAIVGVNGVSANLPELCFGDSYSFAVKFVGGGEDGFVLPDKDCEYLFNIGLMTKATSGNFKLIYGNEETEQLRFDASASDVANALNKLPSVEAVGGVDVVGVNGSPMKITFKKACAVETIGVESNLLPDVKPMVYEVVIGNSATKSVQMLVLKLDTIANVNNYKIDEAKKTLTFDVSLDTVECLLALGQSEYVRLVAEFKKVKSDGRVQTLAQTNITIRNRLIDATNLCFSSIEISARRAIRLSLGDGTCGYLILEKDGNSIHPVYLTSEEYNNEMA